MQHQQCRGGGGGGGGICPHNHNCVVTELSGVSVYVACGVCHVSGAVWEGGGIGFQINSSSASLYACYHFEPLHS